MKGYKSKCFSLTIDRTIDKIAAEQGIHKDMKNSIFLAEQKDKKGY